MLPLSIQIVFEIGALLASILFWSGIKHTSLKWLLPFLILIVSVELYGRYLRKVLHQPNAWLYNISVPIEYLFYAVLFYLEYKLPKVKKATLAFMVLFLIFSLLNIAFVQGFYAFNTNILKVGSFSMMVFSCIYFVELFRQERHVQILKEPMFWLATGVFLFNTGEFFYTLFSDYLIQNHLDKTRKIFSSINNKLIWVLYTCLIIAIVCTEKKPRKT